MTVKELVSILNPTFGQLRGSLRVNFYIYVDDQRYRLEFIDYEKGKFLGNWRKQYDFGITDITDSKVDEPSVVRWIFEK